MANGPATDAGPGQFFDRALARKDLPATARDGQKSTVVLDEYAIPRGPAALDSEFHGLYGKGKRCQAALAEPAK